MAEYKLKINGESKTVAAEPGTPLLWVLRDGLELTGTKYGCGIAQCGACTVHLDGQAVRSCQLAVERVVGKEITTIEGLSADGSHPVQQAWRELDVPQCGYCQAGQIMTAAAFLAQTPNPDDAAIRRAMNGNLCRCASYIRIEKAVKKAAQTA